MADKTDSRPPQVDQMSRHLLGRSGVVNHHPIKCERCRYFAEEHYWKVATMLRDLPGGHHRWLEQNPVDEPSLRARQKGTFSFEFPFSLLEHDPISLSLRLPRNNPRQLCEVRQADVRERQCKDSGPACGETAGHDVGPIAELVDCALNTLTHP